MRRFHSALGLGSALAALVLSAGCPNRDVTALAPTQQKEEKKLIPVGSNRDIDILFVIDNSVSMGEEQDSLKANFPEFMKVLRNIEGGLPNIHVGVVTSNVGVGGYNIGNCTGNGDHGELQNAAHGACSPPSGKYIEDVLIPNSMPPARSQNYTGTLEDTFSCIAALGTSGCGFEQHLESMKQSLDGSNPANEGFYREKAYLAIIIIADEDDCSAVNSQVFNNMADASLTGTLGPLNSFRCTEFGISCAEGNLARSPASYTGCHPRQDSPYIRNPDDYVNFLKSKKTDPNLIIVAGIVGNPEPVRVIIEDGDPKLDHSCQDPAGVTGAADPAVRLKYFLDQFPQRNTLTSICNNDLSPALQKIAENLARVIGNPCLEGNIDTTDLNPGAAGLQIECSVEDTIYPGTEQEESTSIRRCTMDNDTTPTNGQALPCWYVKDDASCHPPVTDKSPSGLQLLVVRDMGVDPPAGAYVQASCVAK